MKNKHLPYDRSERVADAIFRLVADLLRTELSDPRLLGISLTRISLTKDLRTARICFHTPNESQRSEVIKGLGSAKGFIKRRISEEIELKFMPEIEFFYDEGVNTKERIEDLLGSINRGS